MLVFMRHGQRGDNEYPPIYSEVLFDPPITQEAKSSIKSSAEQIYQIFKKYNIKKFSIVSSPFLRCIMTAELFCDHMKSKGVEENGARQIDFSISQYMRPDWFKQYPLKELVLDFKGKSVLSKYLKEPERWKKREFDHNIRFPQNYGNFSKRIEGFQKYLIFPEKNEAIVYVSHGFVVRQIFWRMNQMAEYGQINFCGYAIYHKSIGDKHILLKSKL